MAKCECGCGGECKKRFVHGHNGKGVPRSEHELDLMKKHWSENKELWAEKIKESWTPERKKGHIELRKGKTHSEEHCKKISLGNSGKVRTDEVKQRIANSLKGRFVGEKNPFWKGGTGRAYKNGYYSVQYMDWRKKVFERDNYTCQECGERGGKYLTAHHVKSFAKFPELRFDIDNGKTLCENCHCKIDSYRARFKKKLIV